MVTIQHRINTRTKASSSCSVSNRSNREQMQVLGSEVASRKHRKHSVWSIAEISSRPETCPGRRPSDFAKVSCGGTGRGEQRRVGGQDKHPSMPRAVVASIAHHNLVDPIRRASIPAQISSPSAGVNAVVSDSISQQLGALNPEQMWCRGAK